MESAFLVSLPINSEGLEKLIDLWVDCDQFLFSLWKDAVLVRPCDILGKEAGHHGVDDLN